jgi:hypothetical protein
LYFILISSQTRELPSKNEKMKALSTDSAIY